VVGLTKDYIPDDNYVMICFESESQLTLWI
jgi:hypothetical protein